MARLLLVLIGALSLGAPIVAWNVYPPFDVLTWIMAIVLSVLMGLASLVAFALAGA